ncbi:MAG: T9SS type A sorting domain-containing protein [Saprospiraceae bacterium]
MKHFFNFFWFLIAINGSVLGQMACRDIGINLYFNKYWSKEMPFADLMMQASEWLDEDLNPVATNSVGFSQVTGYPFFVPIVNNGNPHSLKRIICLDNNGIHPKGNYTLHFEGSGNIFLEGDDVDSLVSETSNMKIYHISPKNKGEIILSLNYSDIEDPIREIHLMMPNTELGKDVFNPAFLEKLAPFSTIRFLNWTETNHNTIEKWEERVVPTYYNQTSTKGVSYEYLIQLCNTLGKNMWINIPHAADTIFIENLASLLDNELNSNLQIFLEYSNEVWNTNHASNQWVANKGSSIHSEHQYKYAYFAGQAFKIFTNKFKNHSLTRLLCGQQSLADVALKSVNGMDFFNLNDTYDAISCTGNLYLNDSDRLLAESLGENLTVDQVLQMLENNLETEIIENMARHQDIAQVNGKYLIAYETNVLPLVEYSQFGTPPPHAKGFYQSIYDSRLKELYQRWMNIMFDDFDLELMMAFVLADDNLAHYGSFGHLDNIFQDAPYPPAYQALIESSCLTNTEDESTNRNDNFVTIFPNPTFEGEINIETSKSIKCINVIDIYGKIFRAETMEYGEDIAKVDIDAKGIYFIQILFNDGTKEIQKVVIIN